MVSVTYLNGIVINRIVGTDLVIPSLSFCGQRENRASLKGFFSLCSILESFLVQQGFSFQGGGKPLPREVAVSLGVKKNRNSLAFCWGLTNSELLLLKGS